MVDDVAVEGLEVGDLLRRRLDHDVGAAQVLGELAGQERDREEGEHVGAHGDPGDVGRRHRRAVGPESDPPAVYCATTMAIRQELANAAMRRLP